jgi:hypothetical protein
MDLIELFDRGTRALEEHDSPVSLTRSAELVLKAISNYPMHGVVAASAAAERVLGAMMVMSPDLLVGPAKDAVIFDVNLASGTVLARAAGRLRRSGHDGTIVAVAIHALCEQTPTSIEGADGLVVLENSGIREEATQGRDYRILVAH